MLEFINQSHFFLLIIYNLFLHFSHQLQNWTSKTFLCFGVKERPKITHQPHPGKYTICMNSEYTLYFLDCHSVHSIYLSYSCVLSSDIKNPTSCQGSSIFSLTFGTKISKTRFDMKQSVVNIGSQYILTKVWQKASTMSKAEESLISFFSTLVIIWCYNHPLLADLVFWQTWYRVGVGQGFPYRSVGRSPSHQPKICSTP